MLAYLVQSIFYYKYLILIMLVLLEGPIATLTSGFLIRLGYLSFLPAYFCLIIGDLLGDLGWYAVGYFWGGPFVKRFGKFFSVSDEKVKVIKRVFYKYRNPILFVSKITMGFGFALVTLLTAGLAKIPLKSYLFMNALGELIWSAFLISIGFFFGHLYLTIDGVLGKISIVALLVVVFVCFFGAAKYLRGRVMKGQLL